MVGSLQEPSSYLVYCQSIFFWRPLQVSLLHTAWGLQHEPISGTSPHRCGEANHVYRGQAWPVIRFISPERVHYRELSTVERVLCPATNQVLQKLTSDNNNGTCIPRDLGLKLSRAGSIWTTKTRGSECHGHLRDIVPWYRYHSMTGSSPDLILRY